MKTARLIANVVVGLVLFVLLVGLVINLVVDKASKAETALHPKAYVQEVPFK